MEEISVRARLEQTPYNQTEENTTYGENVQSGNTSGDKFTQSFLTILRLDS